MSYTFQVLHLASFCLISPCLLLIVKENIPEFVARDPWTRRLANTKIMGPFHRVLPASCVFYAVCVLTHSHDN